MIPDGGLIEPSVVGALEAPDRFMEKKTEFFLGGDALGDQNKPTVYMGLRETPWRLEYSDRAIRLIGNGVSLLLIELKTISELSGCFDQYMQPVVLYKRLGVWYLYRFDPFTKKFTTVELVDSEGPIITPRLCFDDKRLKRRLDASVLLTYICNNKIKIKDSKDDFVKTETIKTLSDETYLSQVTMGDNGRLHFVTYTLE